MPDEQKTPPQLSAAAEAALAEIAGITLWDNDPRSYEWPADVYSTICNLSLAAHAMAQAIEQAQLWLAKRGEQGRIGIDADGEAPDLPLTIIGLASSALVARRLAEALDGAAQHAAHLTGLDLEDGQS